MFAPWRSQISVRITWVSDYRKSFIPGDNVGLRKKEFVKPSAQQNGSFELMRGSITSFKDHVEGVLVP